LGYEPTIEDESFRKQKEGENLKIPHIKKTFPYPAEIINMPEVATLTKRRITIRFDLDPTLKDTTR